MCTIHDVNDWGPFISNVSSCEHYGFTLLFEESLFVLLPSACSLALAVWRLGVLAQEDAKAKSTRLRALKMVMHVLFAILALVQLILYALPATPKTRASLASSVVVFVLAVACIPLSALEHTRSVRPCAILEIYFTLSVLLGVIQCQTLWMVHGLGAVAAVATSMIVIRFIALTLEAKGKRHTLEPRYKHVSADGTAGILNGLTLSWLLPLLVKGYQSTLLPSSLPNLQDDMTSASLLARIQRRWNRAPPTKSYALLWMLIRQHQLTVLAGAAFRLCLALLRFAQPFLVQAELSFTSDPAAPSAKGTWLIVAYAGVYLGIFVCQAGAQYYTRKFITMVRGSLVSLLYRHTLRTDLLEASDANPVSLASVDMERIAEGLMTIHETWGSLVEVGLFIWMIERQIHLAVVASAMASLVSLVVSFIIAFRAWSYLTLWLQDIQRRIETTESVLGQFKSIVLAGFMETLIPRISSLRDTEIDTSKAYRAMVVGVLATAYASIVSAPIIGFGLFVFVPSIRGSKVFGSEVAFSALTALTLFTSSIRTLVQAVFELASAHSGFERFRKVLLEPEYVDPRYKCGMSMVPPLGLPPSAVQDMSSLEKDDLGSVPLQTFATDRRSRNFEGTDLFLIKDADIGWPTNRIVLRNVSLTVRRQGVTALSGASGSGKTTFLEAILGHALVSRGTVSAGLFEGAYCSQKPWIFEGTIMDNIVNRSILNTGRYREAVNACGLSNEISQMPLKDMTYVGSNGSRLSGGQRKRLALARALYSGLDLIVLDDVLSGLDPETSRTVWQNLCGADGLLRREGKTVIFASSHDADLVYADDVFDINDGTISKRPPPRDSMLSVRSPLNLSRVILEDTSVPDMSFGFNEPSRLHNAMSNRLSNSHRAMRPEVDEDTLRKTGKQVTGRGDWQAYSYYISSIGKRNSLVLVLLTLLMVLGLQLPQLWIGLWARANEKHNGLGSATYFGVFAAFGGFALLSLVVGGFYFMLKMVPKSTRELHRALLETTLRASVVFINNQSVGDVLNRFSQDLAIVDTDIPLNGFNTIFFVLSCIVQAIIISVSSKYMSAIMVVFLAIFYLVQHFYLRTSRQLRTLDIEAKGPLISHFSDTIAGLKTVRSGGWSLKFEASALAILDASQKPFYLLYSVQVWLGLVLDFLVAVIAITLVAITNNLRGSSTAGFLGTALISVVSFGVNLNQLLLSWTYIETGLQAVTRIKNYADNTPLEADHADAPEPGPQWPEQGRIEFRNVCASYGKDSGLVLDKLSFEIQPGWTTGICGPTGSGKSSLLATLYQLLEHNAGTILIDGVDIQSVPRKRLRNSLVNVSQDSFVVPGTLRFNLDPRGEKTDKQLQAALEAVKLWDTLGEDSLDTDLSKYKYPSGHGQSLSLARALVHSGSIVIVDELTSNLDYESTVHMRQTLQKHFQSRTVVMVSHKLDDLMACDQVLVIEQGRFVEFGDPHQLYGDSGSRFREIFSPS